MSCFFVPGFYVPFLERRAKTCICGKRNTPRGAGLGLLVGLANRQVNIRSPSEYSPSEVISPKIYSGESTSDYSPKIYSPSEVISPKIAARGF